MDTTALTAAVQDAFDQYAAKVQEDDQYGPEFPAGWRESRLLHDCSEAIEPILAAQPEFAKPLMVRLLNGAMGFHPSMVAPMLLRNATERGSAAAAVEWLQKVFGTHKARGVAIYTMRGLRVNASVTLMSDLTLVPFESLPPSPQKEILSERPELGIRHLLVPYYASQTPTSALVAVVDIEPYLLDADDDRVSTSAADLYARFENIRHCLAVARGGPVMPGPSWFQYEDPELQAAIPGGGATSFGHQEVIPLDLRDKGEVDGEKAARIVSDFFATEESVRHRLRTAMERVHLAFIRLSPADKALELAIALETLLVDSPGENTFKIALRAGLLTGEDVQSRAMNRAIISAAYGLRSALMHSGQSPKDCKVRGYAKMPAADVAARATEIAVGVVLRILRDRREPDWNLLELR